MDYYDFNDNFYDRNDMINAQCKSSTYFDLNQHIQKLGNFSVGKIYECFKTKDGFIFFNDDNGKCNNPIIFSNFQYNKMFNTVK